MQRLSVIKLRSSVMLISSVQALSAFRRAVCQTVHEPVKLLAQISVPGPRSNVGEKTVSWLDHIIFAMAPLGIVTAIVAAIRVGGPPWLRAVVGRARENRATVEVEMMSSTSHEVCELWNGQGIVRTS